MIGPSKCARPPGGVYISGLSLDGAIWDKSGACVAEAKPKILFCEMPILFVTAVRENSEEVNDLGPFGGFQLSGLQVRAADGQVHHLHGQPALPTEAGPPVCGASRAAVLYVLGIARSLSNLSGARRRALAGDGARAVASLDTRCRR